MPASESEILRLPPPRGALAPAVEVPVRWRRSGRARLLSMKVCPAAGAVVVTLPDGATRRAGRALIRAHAAWVAEHVAALAPAQPFAPGAEVPLAGAPLLIRHLPHARHGVRVETGALVVGGARARLAARVAEFLRAEARARLPGLVAPHAAALGVVPRAVRVKDTRSRWGSCAPDGTLAFSWRLVMAPGWVADYVVAHEVAHLREMNHSARFWDLVDRLTPHRAAAVAWLKGQGSGLLRAG